MALLGRKFSLFGKNKASAPKDTRPPTIPLPCLLVRFDIEKCNDEGSYGFRCCRLLLDAVDPEELEATILFYGDSDKTLAGLENVFIIAIASQNEDRLKNSIRPLLLKNAALMDHCAEPPVELKSSSAEPLIMCGVVKNGLLADGESQMAAELRRRAKRS